jgi:hypothetical protein
VGDRRTQIQHEADTSAHAAPQACAEGGSSACSGGRKRKRQRYGVAERVRTPPTLVAVGATRIGCGTRHIVAAMGLRSLRSAAAVRGTSSVSGAAGRCATEAGGAPGS